MVTISPMNYVTVWRTGGHRWQRYTRLSDFSYTRSAQARLWSCRRQRCRLQLLRRAASDFWSILFPFAWECKWRPWVSGDHTRIVVFWCRLIPSTVPYLVRLLYAAVAPNGTPWPAQKTQQIDWLSGPMNILTHTFWATSTSTHTHRSKSYS